MCRNDTRLILMATMIDKTCTPPETPFSCVADRIMTLRPTPPSPQRVRRMKGCKDRGRRSRFGRDPENLLDSTRIDGPTSSVRRRHDETPGRASFVRRRAVNMVAAAASAGATVATALHTPGPNLDGGHFLAALQRRERKVK